MPTRILMPALSPTMEDGTLTRWLVKEGDQIRPGEVIAEIETDKATMEFEAADEGTIGQIVIPEGTEGVRVNEVIAILLEDGESSSDVPNTVGEGTAQPARPQAEVRAPAEPETGEDARNGDTRVFASPLARRLAAERGIDLARLSGSGPGGRIVKADVAAAAPEPADAHDALADERSARQSDPVVGSSSGPAALYAGRPYKEVPIDGMRKTIAARLSESKQTVPHFYLRRRVRLDDLLSLRLKMNEDLARREIKLSVNDFVIKAVANALQEVPDCNAIWAEDRLIRFNASDISVAVAIEGGLVTPVLRDAERKSLSALSAEMKDVAARARDRKLQPADYSGGSITISNLGMMGIESFDAIINPPQACIAAVGAAIQEPVVGQSGEIGVATLMAISLSMDHRVIDGALGARFLDAIVLNLESPISMLA